MTDNKALTKAEACLKLQSPKKLYERAQTYEEMSTVYCGALNLCQYSSAIEDEICAFAEQIALTLQNFSQKAQGRPLVAFSKKHSYDCPLDNSPETEKTIFPGGRRNKAKDPKRTERKRMRGGLSTMPPHLAKHFTEGERSTLSVISERWRKYKACDLTAKEIGDLAGVGQTTVRNALRKARRFGLVKIIHRYDRIGKRNLSNICQVICVLWKNWISHYLQGRLAAVKNAAGLMKPIYKNENTNRNALMVEPFYPIPSGVG